MQQILYLVSTLLLLSCDNDSGMIYNTMDTVKQSNDTLNIPLTTDSASVPGTVKTVGTVEPMVKDSLSIGGRHALTLQWISWDKPGSVNFTKDTAGWYKVKGQQRDKQGNYLTIEGKIKPINHKELHFLGKIISKVDGINDGEPCVRDGEQVFLSTQGRKYWRLQSMLNCEGNRVTDYIDIYF